MSRNSKCCGISRMKGFTLLGWSSALVIAYCLFEIATIIVKNAHEKLWILVSIEAIFMGLLPFIPFYLYTFQMTDPSMIMCFYRTYLLGTIVSFFARGEYTLGVINSEAAKSIQEFNDAEIQECEKFGATCVELRK